MPGYGFDHVRGVKGALLEKSLRWFPLPSTIRKCKILFGFLFAIL
jgi:hypothetical protein